MDIVRSAFGKVPQNLGDYNPNNSYGVKERVFMYGCELESLTNNNTFAPMTWDGADNFTIDSEHWKLVTGNPQIWAGYPTSNKPASTGASGSYPYNGMGCVVLKKNMVQGVNTLTQDMFYKGPADSRVPNTNTIFVIQYDFTLGEDITIPANCVLEFDGGSLNGAYTITGSNTKIEWNGCVIFGSNITISGTWLCPVISTKMFSDLSADNALRKLEALNTDDIQTSMYIEKESYDYYFSLPTNYDTGIHIHSNTDVYINGTIKCKDSAAAYQMIQVSNKKNVTICGSGTIVGDWDVHSGGTVASEFGHCIYIGRCENIKIEGLEITKAWGDGIVVSGGSGTPNYRLSVENCSIHHCRRTGIALSNVIGMDISNCYIHHINGTGTGNCIDIELESADGLDYTINDVTISNCRLENGSLIGIASNHGRTIKNVLVENCILHNNAEPIEGYYAITCYGDNIVFNNNIITLDTSLIVGENAIFKSNKIVPHVADWSYSGLFEDNDITVDFNGRITQGEFRRNRITAYGYGAIRGGSFYDNDITFVSEAADQYAIVATNNMIFIGNNITIDSPEGTSFYRIIMAQTGEILAFDRNIFYGSGDIWFMAANMSAKTMNAFYSGTNFCNEHSLKIGLNSTLCMRNGSRLASGLTTDRPTDYVGDGYQFLDTTENKVVTKLRTGWVDATGTTV